jgi:hypothetical protein
MFRFGAAKSFSRESPRYRIRAKVKEMARVLSYFHIVTASPARLEPFHDQICLPTRNRYSEMGHHGEYDGYIICSLQFWGCSQVQSGISAESTRAACCVSCRT